jgi:predicted O-linked N-acetylglucosamine transferase (SPINDLY family)
MTTDIDAMFETAFQHHQQGQLEAASTGYDQVLVLRPDDVEALHYRGLVSLQLGDPERASTLIARSVELDPEYAEALVNLGSSYARLGRHDAAAACFERAANLGSECQTAAVYNLGNALHQLGRFEAALANYDRIVNLDSSYRAMAHYSRAIALQQLKRHREAIVAYEQAMAHGTDYRAEAHCGRGISLQAIGNHEAAIESLNLALASKSDYADALYHRGLAQHELERFDDAAGSYAACASINPGAKYIAGLSLSARTAVSDWSDFDRLRSAVTMGVAQGRASITPFDALSLVASPDLQRQVAEIWVREECPPRKTADADIAPGTRKRKVRLGYFSADFRNHAVSILAAELFEIHDRSDFEVLAFAYGPDTRDEARSRMERAFDQFIDIRELSDEAAARTARSLGIDIAIDLTGYTKNGRPGIFAERVAPLQVSYLGYLGTTGASYVDYLIADDLLVPQDARRHYSEKLIYLPNYQVNDSRRHIAERTFSRAELGLPAAGFVYCCFNARFKILPATFDSWMRILARVPDSVLYLYSGGGTADARLRCEAQSRGIAPSRLVFGGRLPAHEYLARYRTADLFLDTMPYNAGTTASDALWSGLPVLTCAGETFAGRMGASILRGIGMPELIAADVREYEELAVAHALDRGRMNATRRKLEANRSTAMLFDTALFARNLEAAYREILARSRGGLPPDHVFVRNAALAADHGTN